MADPLGLPDNDPRWLEAMLQALGVSQPQLPQGRPRTQPVRTLGPQRPPEPPPARLGPPSRQLGPVEQRVDDALGFVPDFTRGFLAGTDDPSRATWGEKAGELVSAWPGLAPVKAGALGLAGVVAKGTRGLRQGLVAERTALKAGQTLADAVADEAVAATRAIPRAQATMATRYPRLARAYEKHGVSPELPGANRSWAASVDRMAQQIHDITRNKGGTTVDPLTSVIEATGPKADPGVMAGVYANQNQKTYAVPLADFTPDSVRQFLETHADTYIENAAKNAAKAAKDKDPRELRLGTWVDHNAPNGPMVYIDVSEKYPTVRQATVAAARRPQPATTVRDPTTGKWPLAQEAVFDLQTENVPPVANFAEAIQEPWFRDRMEAMRKAGQDVMGGKDWWDLHGSSVERIYGSENLRPMAGFLAATSSGSPPVENARAASEYMRRLLKGEEIIQPDFRIPETAVGWTPTAIEPELGGSMGRPGLQMPKEATRDANLLKASEGRFDELQDDKVNDMFSALVGRPVGVFDRHWAKLAEDPARGIYAESAANKLAGSKVSGRVGSYALVENQVRDAAQAAGVPLPVYSAQVWEGIRDTIKRTGELFGTKYDADAIPEIVGGFPGIFDRLVEQKAASFGISVAEMEKRLREGDAELLMAILGTPVGLAAYQQWQQGGQTPGSQSPPGT